MSKLLLPVSSTIGSKMEKITTKEFYMSLSKYIFFNTSKIATNDLKSTLSKGGFSSNTIFANVIFDKATLIFSLSNKVTLSPVEPSMMLIFSGPQTAFFHIQHLKMLHIHVYQTHFPYTAFVLHLDSLFLFRS